MHQEPKDNSINHEMARILEKIEEHLAILRAQAPPTREEWLTIPDVAEDLKISTDTVQRLIVYGKLKATELETPMGKGCRHLYRIHRTWVHEFMTANIRQIVQNTKPYPPRCPRRGKTKLDFVG